jgi:hypothetical protein
MQLRGASPKFPEPHERKAARLEARLNRIAPGGRLTSTNGSSIPISHLEVAVQRRASAFELPSDPVANAVTGQIIASGIKTIRHVTESGGRLADTSLRKLIELEAVVDAIRRVSWYVENGDYVVQIRTIDDGLDAFWRDAFETERARVRTVCASVAAIMIDSMPVGTGWLAAENTLFTNAHVALQLCYRQPGLPPSDPRDRWRLASGRNFTAAFRFEHDKIQRTDAHLHVPIVDVLHLETSQSPDLAIFRLMPPQGQSMPKPLGLGLDWNPAAKSSSDTTVYAVGHPIQDLQDDAANVELSFVGSLDGTKRFSPGKITGNLGTDTLAHDCSTTNGSSGSPLLAIGNAAPIALHYFGRPGVRNEAVLLSAWATHPAIKLTQTGKW